MTVDKDVQSIRLQDLVALCAAVTLALAYFETPLLNALLVALAILLQAATGTVLISKVLAAKSISMSLLLGPGLILGGAVSFVGFQVAGRGLTGIAAVVVLGVASLIHLIRMVRRSSTSVESAWMLSQIVGIAGIALAFEFPEAWPLAAAGLALGYLNNPSRPRGPITTWIISAVLLTVIGLAITLRQNYWWLVSDDYRFFQVLADHITRDGPLANWGLLSFERYHWFSYGWAGLLEQLSGNPERLVILTRTMPVVYSISLGASLLLMLSSTYPRFRLTFGSIVPIWLILGLNPLDWSGVSTAGVYSVLASTVAASLLAFKHRTPNSRRLLIYSMFIPIIALTKISAIFSAVCAVAILEMCVYLRDKTRTVPFWGTLIVVSLAVAVVPISISSLGAWLSSIGLPSFSIVDVTPSLGQLSEYGRRFAVYCLILKYHLLLLLIVVTCLVVFAKTRRGSAVNSQPMLAFLAPLIALGVFLQVVVGGPANTNEYFGLPFIFLASLSILANPDSLTSTYHGSAGRHRFPWLISCAVFLFVGFAWSRFRLSQHLWQNFDQFLSDLEPLQLTLLEYVSSDSRFGLAAIGGAVAVFVVFSHRKFLSSFTHLLVCVALALTILESYGTARGEFRRVRTTEEIESVISNTETRQVGQWLILNTSSDDLIATNQLYHHRTERPLTDFSLAVWSRREFLVLGIGFAGNFESLIPAVNSSINFGNEPTLKNRGELASYGVDWFVVDRLNQPNLSLFEPSEIYFENERYLVVRIR